MDSLKSILAKALAGFGTTLTDLFVEATNKSANLNDCISSFNRTRDQHHTLAVILTKATSFYYI